MSLIHTFGKAFDRKLIPKENDKPVKLPTQSPTIYIFTSQPSRSVGQTGTGAVQTITSWEESDAPPFQRIYQVGEIEDPDPTGSLDYKEYWEAINFRAKTAGQLQTIIRMFRVERLESPDQTPGTTRETLKEIYPNISAYLLDAEMDDQIETAETELRTYFKARGMKWSRIHGLGDLKLALAYKAIALSAGSQFKEENDRFWLRMKMFEKKCSDQLSLITLDYDANGDGAAEIKEKASSGSWSYAR